MTDEPTFVIVGAGLAGAKAARDAARTEGFDGRIVLLGAEPHRPYERPPLSKGYLQGSADRDTVFVHPPEWYADHDVDLRLGTAVTALDRGAHEIVTADGNRERLRQAAAGHRRLHRAGCRCPAPTSTGVHYLRTLDDSDQLKAALRPGTRVVIIGGGLDRAGDRRRGPHRRRRGDRARTRRAAAAARARAPGRAGLRRPAPRPRRRPALRRHGRPRSGPPAPTDDRRRGAARRRHHAGRRRGHRRHRRHPERRAGPVRRLDVDNGILVDEHLRTSDDDIFAAGDVANAYHPLLGRHLRVEHWANALHQPAVAAKAMLGEARHLRPAAVLLHRPVRPGHGVHRLHRARRLRPGRDPRRPATPASSSRSGYATSACWPG